MPTLNPTTTFSSTHGDARDGPPESELFCHHDPLEFQLRGHSLNPLVDVAMPLFGLVIRLRRTEVYGSVEHLHGHLTNQIKVMLEELRQHAYSEVELRVFSYGLCVFVDEAVLATPWGSGSMWQAKSLLSSFHQETWGGETFFTLLTRLQETPEKYRDVLLFMYLCLGFKGQYSVQTQGDQSLQHLITRLRSVLGALQEPAPARLTRPLDNVAPRHYQMNRQWPWWTPWVAATAICLGAYGFFAIRLHSTTQQVMLSLEALLLR
ncbi:type IVB secretion system protein IcmH/DotU [Pseudomonas mucidolens]|uniref:type IVB secretion system protein IcmH/DotU n=1 Tax=Pseudomonas mucidolens TaxID=46679 RepID=UPI0030D845AE